MVVTEPGRYKFLSDYRLNHILSDKTLAYIKQGLEVEVLAFAGKSVHLTGFGWAHYDIPVELVTKNNYVKYEKVSDKKDVLNCNYV